MVVDVEEGELVPLLPQDDENRVHEVEDLGDVEHPQERADGRVRGVERLAGEEGVALLGCGVGVRDGVGILGVGVRKYELAGKKTWTRST